MIAYFAVTLADTHEPIASLLLTDLYKHNYDPTLAESELRQQSALFSGHAVLNGLKEKQCIYRQR